MGVADPCGSDSAYAGFRPGKEQKRVAGGCIFAKHTPSCEMVLDLCSVFRGFDLWKIRSGILGSGIFVLPVLEKTVGANCHIML